jgi:hypothetical protein
MDNPFEPAFPDPRDDPEFFSGKGPGKAAPNSVSGYSGSGRVGIAGARRFPEVSRVLVFVLAMIWLGLLLDPIVGLVVVGLLTALAMTLAIVMVAMVLGIMGRRIFTASDLFFAWLRQSSRWPEE